MENKLKAFVEEKKWTQEQFAMKLNVSRFSVSNWENTRIFEIKNANFDVDVFQISLDYLIKEEKEMNNMTEKVIKDGSETRRAKYNMVCSIIGSFLILIGIILLFVKGLSVEYIDAQGVQHEHFFLTPNWIFMLFSV